ncbi:MAG: hypothetical protein H6821_07015 [Planctomycetaceae bacterium]|nr:hypothetical protein [Hyphomicrobiaceae bacterium]MCB9873916.1 hypothetical protein [Planctomycetaceae bacterium]MCB9937391.1 hypothetical protein [Planctomycetaceae bacterium]
MNHKVLQLRELLNRKESEKKPHSAISSGCQPLDRLLPQRGFQQGSLVEWIAGGVGSGASLLALLAARSACYGGGALVLVDRGQSFYPPAANACQLDLQNTIVVHPANGRDECWAIEQALRCPDVAAVVAWPARLTSQAFRRLQLAAEHGSSLGLLIRSATARNESSWASVRMLVSPRSCPLECGDLSPLSISNSVATTKLLASPSQPTDKAMTSHRTPNRKGWRLGVELLRCGGLFGTKPIELEIDHQTGEVRDAYPLPLAAQLAGTAPDPRQATA